MSDILMNAFQIGAIAGAAVYLLRRIHMLEQEADYMRDQLRRLQRRIEELT